MAFPGIYSFETAPAATNVGFSADIPGLLEFRVTRAGNSTPAEMEAIVAAIQSDENPGLKRFYPFQKVRIYDANELLLFVGRLDEAKLREDDQYGRVWQLKGRDALAVLADNYVDRGTWLSARGDHNPSSEYIPNYSGDYDDTGTVGEYRKNIILDLALNVIGAQDYSLDPLLQLNNPPNSKRIEINFDNNQQITILDAIRRLARDDPWSTELGGEVDAKMIADAGFPDGSGFGGELQLRYRTLSDGGGGTLAEYFRRGQVFPVIRRYRYGPPNALDTAPIVSYAFDREGADIFSRARTAGAGEGIYRRNQNGGRAVALDAMESTWDPENGLFNVRREAPVRFDADVGDWTREELDDEEDAIRARALRDAAYAQLQSGAAAVAKFRGVNRGSITIGGLPGPAPNLLRPGDLIRIIIPQMGLDSDDESSDFICEQWTYAFPEDQTTIQVARRPFVDLSEQLVNNMRMTNDASSGHNDHFDSGWRLVDGTGTMVVKHSLGVRARSVKVSAGLFDGKELDGQLIPERGTEVEVHALAFDAGQGMNQGYAIVESTPYYITLKFARWLSYSEGAGRWLRNNETGVTLVRVVLTP